MRPANLVLILGVLGLACPITKIEAQSAAAASLLSGPWQQKAQAAAFSLKGQNVSFPLVSNGYMLSYARVFSASRQSVIFLTALSTGQQRQIPFWISRASAIRLEAGDVTIGGHVLVAGSYTQAANGVEVIHGFANAPGAKDIVNFVAEIDSTGNVIAMNDMGPYTPELICSDGDNTFWTIGQEWPEEVRRGPAGNYSLLRHYARYGAQMDAVLPRSNVTKGIIPNYHAKAENGSRAFLSCGEGSVGALLEVGPRRAMWVEVDKSTKGVEILSTRYPAGGVPTGMALFGKSAAYATFGTTLPMGRLASGRRSDLFSLAAVQSQGTITTWNPVPRVDAGTVFSILLGRDGASIVHLQGTEPPTKDPTVYWSKP